MLMEEGVMESQIFFESKKRTANDFFDTCQEYFLLLNDLFYMTYACLKSKKDFEWTEKNVLELR